MLPPNRFGRIRSWASASIWSSKPRTGAGTFVCPTAGNPQTLTLHASIPVVVDVYGGPHFTADSETVERADSLFDRLLAANGFLGLPTLDNPGLVGTGPLRGNRRSLRICRETRAGGSADGAWITSNQLPYVDGSRNRDLGGNWSYGGYMTLYALTHAPEVFKCGGGGCLAVTRLEVLRQYLHRTVYMADPH